MDPLHLSLCTIEELLDPAYWRAVVPWLHIAEQGPLHSPFAVAAAAAAATAAAAAAAAAAAVPLLAAAPLLSLAAAAAGGGAEAAALAAAPLLAVAVASAAAAAAAAAAKELAQGSVVGGGGAGCCPASAALDAAARRGSLLRRGFFRMSAAETALPAGLAEALEAGVHRLVALGHAPSAVSMYDEAWQLAAALQPSLEAATGNPPSGDTVAFLVTPSRHLFAGPHRDKPLAGAASFRSDGAPQYVTVWVALSDAPPDSSCLYFVPADRDAGYLLPGDAIAAALPSPAHWPAIVAQPCARGEALCFSHRLLHWGGASDAGAPPRCALSFSFSDAAFEAAAFASTHLPSPPHGLRLGLLAGQAIVYASQAPLSKGELALNNRVFASQRALFLPEYAEKVLSAAQTLKFMARNGGGGGRR